MILEIKSDCLTAGISTFGAELQSVKSICGTEFIWNGDKNIWGERCPVLFPICGSLKNDSYTYKGKGYTMKKHGFAKRSEFECVKHTDNYAELVLKSTDEIKKIYPFDFEFHVCFSIDGNKLFVEYKTINLSSGKMYFSVGAHEGYSCPEGIEEYRVVFPLDDELKLYNAKSGYVSTDYEILPLENHSLNLKKEMFAIDALIFRELNSKEIYLENKKTGKKIALDFHDFAHLLIWTKPIGNYVCLEPWNGIPDEENVSGKIEEKKSIITLESGMEKNICHTITFED